MLERQSEHPGAVSRRRFIWSNGMILSNGKFTWNKKKCVVTEKPVHLQNVNSVKHSLNMFKDAWNKTSTHI